MAQFEVPERRPGASMLLEFRARNARSFLEPVDFSLEATRLSEPDIPREIDWRKGGKPLSVLPAAGIFGANASGKSNLLKAMNDLQRLVVTSFQRGRPDAGMDRKSFLLGSEKAQSDTTYEVELILNEVRHSYGVRLDSERVLEEWAYAYPHGRAALIFHRDLDEVNLGAAGRSRGRATIDILRPNALFLSTGGATNHPALAPLFRWFWRNLWLADEETRITRQGFTATMLEGEERREQVLNLLREADLGITGAIRRQIEDPKVRNRIAHQLNVLEGSEERLESAGSLDFADFEVRLKHQAARGEVELAAEDESMGTLIWFGLAGPVLDALDTGAVLLIDELDASLHPTLAETVVRLFQSRLSNPNRAQLIFNSHDVTLMDSGMLGRDQIWFTEKGRNGGSRLYPLTDLDPRKGEAIGRRYLAGRYGATPLISPRQLEQIAEPVDESG